MSIKTNILSFFDILKQTKYMQSFFDYNIENKCHTKSNDFRKHIHQNKD